uniref:Huntingtin interacting protein 1 related n=1 Tax=Meleagris gallopavo TaxID=9103 RepID=A0A803YMS5_MELGA
MSAWGRDLFLCWAGEAGVILSQLFAGLNGPDQNLLLFLLASCAGSYSWQPCCPRIIPGYTPSVWGWGVHGRAEHPCLQCYRFPLGVSLAQSGVVPSSAQWMAFGKAMSVLVNDQAGLTAAGRLCKHVSWHSLLSPLQFSGSSTPPWQCHRCQRCSAAWHPSSRSSRTAATSTTTPSSSCSSCTPVSPQSLQFMGMPCSQPGPGLRLEGRGCMGINLGLSLQPGSILAVPIATGLPADTLQGHRDRFHEQFRSLKNFFKKASDMLYFKRLIQIPRLPESPPNFLRASALAEHVKPVVVIPEEAPEDEEPENLIEISTVSTTEPQVTSDIFEQTFGPPNGIRDDRDAQIESLKKEVDTLRAEMEKIKLEAQRYITQLKAQVNSLEGEVEEQRKQKQKALVDNEQLRDELERLQQAKQDSERSLRLCAEAEKKASATEMRYTKLKEKHSELINTHAELLRKNADTAKQLTVTQQSQEEVARVKEQLAFQVEQVKREAELKLEDQSVQMEQLRQELEARRDELDQAQRSLGHAKQAGTELSAQLETLQAEKEQLRRSVSEKECELLSVHSLVQEKELQLSQEADKASKEICELQGRLLEKCNQEQSLQQKLLDEQFSILQETVREAEGIFRDAMAKLDDPLHVRCTSSPDYLLSRAEAALESTDALESGHAQYVASMAGLTETCRDCGQRSLDYLGKLKDKQTLGCAELGDVRQALRGVLGLAQELRPKSLDIKQEELGDMVEKEMASTSAAIEDAVRRIEDMMSRARNESSGIKLEVNERILNSCTDLMKAIRLLVMTSTNLQKEIVESGRGAATTQEFYAKNSRWTEGLISASKAVGWGATQLVESADRVVLQTGKYEELIVCSHEIAASTAQLVAASKVKAEKSSRNLGKLQECSRNVNEMAANVVASTRSGQEQIEDKDTMDFSGMSLIKLKKEEMETQVKVLELEKCLEGERVRLGELRKQHYALAGPYDAAEDGEARPAPAPRRGILKKPALAQKPGHVPGPGGEPERDASLHRAHVVNF